MVSFKTGSAYLAGTVRAKRLFFCLGMGGFASVVAWSVYNYRKKSASTSTSVYVIQTRVAAQGLVIGLLTFGVGYHMIQKMRQSYAETHHLFPNHNGQHHEPGQKSN